MPLCVTGALFVVVIGVIVVCCALLVPNRRVVTADCAVCVRACVC